MSFLAGPISSGGKALAALGLETWSRFPDLSITVPTDDSEIAVDASEAFL